jgi:hypothetical protein
MICYHGTIKKYFKIIKKYGLREWSYLTPFLSSALSMGGPYIFGIEIEEVTDEWLGKGNWEYRNPEIIYPHNFLFYAKYSNKLLNYNQKLDDELNKRRKLSENHIFCENCKGKGELTYLNNGHHWKIGGARWDYPKSRTTKKCVVCPDCNGFGYINYEEN